MLARQTVYMASSQRPKSVNRRPLPRQPTAQREPEVSSELSHILLTRLSEISQQLGSSTASLEALREDMKDAADTNKSFSLDTVTRLDNINMRVGVLEKDLKDTRRKVDDIIMPLVGASNLRRQQISGALKVWGAIIVVVTGISTVFWSRLLNWILWASGVSPS